MDKLVAEYIKSKRNELQKIKQEKYQSEKESFLIEQGFCEKVYAPENESIDKTEFPYCEYEQTNEPYLRYKHFKCVPLNISDEDYESMLEAYDNVMEELEDGCEDDKEDDEPKNKISIFMLVVAISIYIGGFIAGIVVGKQFGGYWFSWIGASISWIATFICGSLFMGLYEIIRLLHHQSSQT